MSDLQWTPPRGSTPQPIGCSSKLSEAQGQFSYVVNQASYMSRNPKYEDRSQLGKDLIEAANNNRVIYLTYHLDTKTGKVTARQIQ